MASIAIAIAVAAGGTGAGADGAQVGGEAAFDASATYRVPAAGAPARGPDDAVVTLVEYSDFNCRYCRRASETVAELQRLYPRELRVIYRHSLLDPEDGTLAAEAASAAAAQGRFWAFHDRVFAERGAIDRAALESCAREVGLDMARFRRDLDGGRFRSAVREEDRVAAQLGVSATPAFFINGRPLIGSHSLGMFIAVIEEERAQAEALLARGVARGALYDQVTAGGLHRAGPIKAGADQPAEPALDQTAIYPVGLGPTEQRLGDDDALVTIVEFGDYRCGYCARVNPVLGELLQQYGGDLRIVYRHLPLAGNPESHRLAEAAAAAGEQGRFWDMHIRLFATGGRLDRPEIEALAAGLGLDASRFRAALDRRRFAAQVSADAAEGARLGITGTPTFFVNGTPIIGAAPADMFRGIIDKKLTEARALVSRGVPRAEVYRRVTERKRGR
jgi:protein-disulfide isomerase